VVLKPEGNEATVMMYSTVQRSHQQIPTTDSLLWLFWYREIDAAHMYTSCILHVLAAACIWLQPSWLDTVCMTIRMYGISQCNFTSKLSICALTVRTYCTVATVARSEYSSKQYGACSTVGSTVWGCERGMVNPASKFYTPMHKYT
jgi:hypothetical protein